MLVRPGGPPAEHRTHPGLDIPTVRIYGGHSEERFQKQRYDEHSKQLATGRHLFGRQPKHNLKVWETRQQVPVNVDWGHRTGVQFGGTTGTEAITFKKR